MISLKVTKDRNSAKLRVSGQMTFDHVNELVQEFRTLLKKTTIVLDLSAVDEFDLTGLQFLYSARSGSESHGYQLTIVTGEQNGPRLQKMFDFVGLKPVRGLVVDDR